MIIKEAKKNVFDGWTDWRYDLLKCGICLCDEKSVKKLERVLDTLLERSQEDCFPEYTKKEDLIVDIFYIDIYTVKRIHTRNCIRIFR